MWKYVIEDSSTHQRIKIKKCKEIESVLNAVSIKLINSKIKITPLVEYGVTSVIFYDDKKYISIIIENSFFGKKLYNYWFDVCNYIVMSKIYDIKSVKCHLKIKN